MPSGGLTAGQIMRAVQEMGYSPLPYEPTSASDARRKCYRYIESGIPVLIAASFGGEGHVVTAIGHRLDLTGDPPFSSVLPMHGDELSINYQESSDYVPSFLIHDDAGGPFRQLQFIDVPIPETDPPDSICGIVLDRGTPTEESAALIALIIPMPPGVTLDGESALETALQLTSELHVGDTPKPHLLFRTYLCLSNGLKTKLAGTVRGSTILSTQLRRHLMSKWVWVSEIAHPSEYTSGKLAFSEIIQDCAGHAGRPTDADVIAVSAAGSLRVVHPDGRAKNYRIPLQTRIEMTRPL